MAYLWFILTAKSTLTREKYQTDSQIVVFYSQSVNVAHGSIGLEHLEYICILLLFHF